MRMPKNLSLAALAGLALAAGLPLGAGTDSPLEANLSINYQPPGARSQAMGGAFIALSDDASAIAVNPAGLVQLNKPEVMTQFFSGTGGLDVHNFAGEYVEQSGFGHTPTNLFINDLSGNVANGNGQGINFLSFVWPFKKAVLAVSYSRPVDFHANGITEGQLFEDEYFFFNPNSPCFPGSPNCIAYDVSDPPQGLYGRLRVEQFTVAGAFRIGKKFSLGAALSYNKFNQDFSNYFYIDTVRLPDHLRFILTERASDNDWSGSFGLLFQPIDQLSLGASYRRGTQFSNEVRVNVINSSFTNIVNDSFNTSNRLPDQYGIGVVWRPKPIFLVTVDVNRVRYSQLLKGLRTVNQYQVDRNVLPQSFTIGDGTEPHLGLEYVAVAGGAPLVFRAGAWREAAHGLKFVEGAQYFTQDPTDPTPVPDPDIYNRFVQTIQKNRFPGTRAQTHYSAGIGLVIKQKFQFDMGYDFSRLSKQFIMSGIWRFNGPRHKPEGE
jgi:long-subunit fatty acid transport protein